MGMGEFYIKPYKIISQIERLNEMYCELQLATEQIYWVLKNLNMQVQARNQINNSLKNAALDNEKCCGKMQVMSSALSQIVDLYRNTEKIAAAELKKTKIDFGKSDLHTKQEQTQEQTKDNLFYEKKFAQKEWDVGGNIVSGAISGIFGGMEISSERGVEVNNTIGFSGRDSLDIYLAKGEVSSNIGLVSGEVSASVADISGEIKGEGYLIQNGIFAPAFVAGVEASASIMNGQAGVTLGKEDNNFHAKMEGTVLGAEADNHAAIGYIVGEDGDMELAIDGAIGAEAYLVKGEVECGLSVMGIKVNTKFEGKAGAIGATASGKIGDNGIRIGAGLSALLGLEFELEIDWSDFKLPSVKDLKFW